MKGDKVLRIVFQSCLVALLSNGREHEVVQSICERAHASNQESHISAVLFFDPENLVMVQIMEGLAMNVHKLYETIYKDRRHDRVEMKFRRWIDTAPCRPNGMHFGTAADWDDMKPTLAPLLRPNVVASFDKLFALPRHGIGAGCFPRISRMCGFAKPLSVSTVAPYGPLPRPSTTFPS